MRTTPSYESVPHLLLVAAPGPARDAYLRLIHEAGATADLAASFAAVPALAGATPYSALLADIRALLQGPAEQKRLANQCVAIYPAARAKYDAGSGRVQLFVPNQTGSGDAGVDLKRFLAAAAGFKPRTLRLTERRPLTLNVRATLLRGTAPVRTFTVDLSTGGCFLHTTVPLPLDTLVQLEFVELPALGEVTAAVSWQLPWGAKRAICGVGVRFIDLEPAQAACLTRLLEA